jgi:GT2 family glycosyltransferase
MPAYNAQKFIEFAVSSVLEQTYKNIELIIVDDGSVDSTKAIIDRLSKSDKRICLLLNKKNIGIAASLNKAIDCSKGEYIARLDSDDICMPTRIAKQIEFMERHKNVSICGSWAIAIDEKGRKIFNMYSPIGLLLKYNYWKPSPFISSSVMVRRSLLKKSNFDENFRISEDYDLWVRILNTHKGYNISRPLIKYRIHGSSMSNRMSKEGKEMSLRSFSRNFKIHNINLETFLSLTCMEFKLSGIRRFKLLWKIKKKIGYPIWFLILDNLYYGFRKIIFTIKPELKKYG